MLAPVHATIIDSMSDPAPDRSAILLNAMRQTASGEGAASLAATDTIQRWLDVMNEESPAAVLAQAALAAAKATNGGNRRLVRDGLRFLARQDRSVDERLFTRQDAGVRWTLDSDDLAAAVRRANLAVEAMHDLSLAFGVEFFELLGLRNLSSTMGELFAREIHRGLSGKVGRNPNQDGYPDLIALTPHGVQYLREREERRQMSEKSFWSPFPFGGIEVKATCGNTPAAAQVAKPKIGESRMSLLQSAEWKAHHRETNNLVGVFWDFVDGLPTFLAIFFRNDLCVDDWGRIVQPREGGGRTTSVSLMQRRGVEKMGQGWLVLPDNASMLTQLGRQRVFAFGDVSRYRFSRL